MKERKSIGETVFTVVIVLALIALICFGIYTKESRETAKYPSPTATLVPVKEVTHDDFPDNQRSAATR